MLTRFCGNGNCGLALTNSPFQIEVDAPIRAIVVTVTRFGELVGILVDKVQYQLCRFRRSSEVQASADGRVRDGILLHEAGAKLGWWLPVVSEGPRQSLALLLDRQNAREVR